jgi:aspartate aminotransferase-like enzyme
LQQREQREMPVEVECYKLQLDVRSLKQDLLKVTRDKANTDTTNSVLKGQLQLTDTSQNTCFIFTGSGTSHCDQALFSLLIDEERQVVHFPINHQ